MNNSTFTKDFWRYLIIFVVAIVIICFFPFWFTKSGLLDFTNTGQIGDTIGGVMGPFVAIAASVLTFLAFWVQYKANEQQRKDIALVFPAFIFSSFIGNFERFFFETD